MPKQIEVGDWDSPGQMIEVEDNATVADVFRTAGRSLSSTERVARMNTGQIVSLDEVAAAGESFMVLQNNVSG